MKIFFLFILFCNIIFSAKLHASNKPFQAKLQEHQLQVVKYLNDYPQVRGLLLYHALGSGKTVTSIAAAESQTKNVIVILPRVLVGHWKHELKKFGYSKQYKFITIESNDDLKLINENELKNSFVIVDEFQKLIEKDRNDTTNHIANNALKMLSHSNRILLLSGTPIYSDATDYAFIGNLILGKDHYPTNPTLFKEKFLTIDPLKSLARGYLLESRGSLGFLPIYGSGLGLVLMISSNSNSLFILTQYMLTNGIYTLGELFPTYKVGFRVFNSTLFEGFIKKHVSFYSKDNSEDTNYPEVTLVNHDVLYNCHQLNRYLDLLDSALSYEDLSEHLKDQKSKFHENFIRSHPSEVQRILMLDPLFGSEIGNLSFEDPKTKKSITPEKFLKILNFIKANKGKSAIYSSYVHNGTELIKNFLENHGYSDKITEIKPTLAPVEIQNRINLFNKSQDSILIIHPEITEGISLRGVEHFHILEPIKNIALQNQIIGRAVRYKSHSHLPSHRNKVTVHLWNSKVNSNYFFPTQHDLVLNDNWKKRYSEINSSSFLKGIRAVDPNFYLKKESPDTRISEFSWKINGLMNDFKEISSTHSIETQTHKKSVKWTPEYDTYRQSLKTINKSSYSYPLVSWNYEIIKDSQINYGKYTLLSKQDNKGLSYSLEIPWDNFVNVGYTFKFFKSNGFTYNNSDILSLIGIFASEFGFLTKMHYEPTENKSLSLYSKLELGSTYWLPMFLGVYSRVGFGLQYSTGDIIGLSLEFGIDNHLMYPSEKANDILPESITKSKNLSYYHSYISFGLISRYY